MRRALDGLLILLLLAACGQDGPPARTDAGGFRATLGVDALEVVRGGSGELPVELLAEGGFDGSVDLALAGAPSGVTLDAAPLRLAATAPQARRLALHVSESVPAARYGVTLVATSGTLRHEIDFALAVTLPPGAEIARFDADRTGLPKEGGAVRLEWEALRATRYVLEVAPSAGATVGGLAYEEPVRLPVGTNAVTLGLPENPGTGPDQVPYTLTLTAHGAAGTPAAARTIGLFVGGVDEGALAIVVDGLPEGAAADVRVTGMDLDAPPVEGNDVLLGLAPGPYRIEPREVVAPDGIVYEGAVVLEDAHETAVQETSVVVEAGAMPTVAVRYESVAPSLLGFTIDPPTLGPEGGEATLAWRGRSVAGYAITASEALDGFPHDVAGETTTTVRLPPNPARDARRTYTFALVGTGADGATTAPLEATASVGPLDSGALQLAIEGIPATADGFPGVELRGPSGDAFPRQTVDGDHAFAGLPPGTYELHAPDLHDAHGNAYRAEVAPGPAVEVLPGATTSARVAYATDTGALLVVARGLPDDATPRYRATPEAAVPITFDGADATAVLPAGTYALDPLPIEASDGFVYDAEPTGLDAEGRILVPAGDAVAVEAPFLPTSGAIEATLRLPAGVAGDVAVACDEGGTPRLTESGLVPYLAGSCTVAAVPVAHAGTTYRATPADQNVAVEAGRVVPVEIRYEADPPAVATLDADPARLPAEGGTVRLAWTAENVAGYAFAVAPDAGVLLPPAVDADAVEAALDLPANPTKEERTYLVELRAHGTGGGTATRGVPVTVAPGVGTLVVTQSGLPAGSAYEETLEIMGGTGVERTLPAGSGAVPIDLPIGAYDVHAPEVDVDGARYAPTVTGAPARVTGGAEAHVVVLYDQVF